MGLRINTNTPSLTALRNLRVNDRNQSRSLERLSTGLRINRASDDPSGLVISEALRVQIKGLEQAVQNSEDASGLIGTADAALGEVLTILSDIKDSIVFAQNTGGASPDQIRAEQDNIDQSLGAIDRIATTTRFSDRTLLNGTAAFTTTSGISTAIQDLTIRSALFAGSQDTRTFNINVDREGLRAELQVQDADVASGGVTVRVTGSLGTEDITIASAAGSAGIANAINAVAGFTGVFAENSGTTVTLNTDEFGNGALIQVEVISGTLSGNVRQNEDTNPGLAANLIQSNVTVGFKASDRGQNAQISIEGVQVTGVGKEFNFLSRLGQFQFALASGTAAGTTQSFTVRNTGLAFQLNEQPNLTDRISVGIDAVNSANLGETAHRDRILEAQTGTSGTVGGFLNSLQTGGANDLFSNPENASRIVDAAISKVSNLRSFLGAVQQKTIEPNVQATSVHLLNLQSSRSRLTDLDFALETANFTKTQILFQANTAVLASANLIPQSILSLIG